MGFHTLSASLILKSTDITAIFRIYEDDAGLFNAEAYSR